MGRSFPRGTLRRTLVLLADGLAAASLVAAMAVASLWCRGYDDPEHFWVSYRSGVTDSVKSDRGSLTFARRRTPFPVRSTSFFHESGLHVRSRLATGSFPLERRWGPFVYAEAPPAPPPTAAQFREADLLTLKARAFDTGPPTGNESELMEWSDRRAEAYRTAREAHRRLSSSRTSVRLVVVPCWALALPLLVLPAVRGWRWYRLGPTATSSAGAAERQAAEAAPTAGPATTVKGTHPATPAGAAAPEMLPYTDRRNLAARIAAYRGDRLRQRGPPRRPRPYR